ncbi:hypothetical protein NMY22_g4563 [Coprinellus aureogranulatus]|nr:hypothetical protein NMY22_g4563 [Coprinellus aureogranulatus]
MAEGAMIARELDLDLYHSTSGKNEASEVERQAKMQRWIRGERLGLVCTSALGAGNDYGHVRLMIHAGSPYDMVLFNQQSGRGGRDRKTAWSVILADKVLAPKEGETTHLLGSEQLGKLIKAEEWPDSCFRYSGSRVMDGTAKHCWQLPCHYRKCSSCREATYQGPQEASPIIAVEHNCILDICYCPEDTLKEFGRTIERRFKTATVAAQEKAIEDATIAGQKLSQYMEILRNLEPDSCGACFVFGRDERHGPYSCPFLEEHLDLFQRLQSEISYPDDCVGPFFSDLCDVPDVVPLDVPTVTPEAQLEEELNRYWAFEGGRGDLFDPLRWWKENGHRYPVLSRMARDYLAIPATSVSVERTFSKSRRICTELRASLNPTTVTQSLLTKIWINSKHFRLIDPPERPSKRRKISED